MTIPISGAGNVSAVGIQQAVGSGQQDWRRLELGTDAGPSFADSLKQALGEVSALQDGASDAIAAFVRGEPVELHQVMAATEEAGIALDLLIEIRNRITEAYRTVVAMQA